MASRREVWQRLRRVSAVQWACQSQAGIGWRGSGSGTVSVSEPAPDVLWFAESGSWQQDGGRKLRFSNLFRWSFIEDRLRLDHLRFGPDKPVFLFEMAADADGIWRETEPHLCRDDCYRASLRLEDEQIRVSWRIDGPKRSEVVEYRYS